MSTTPQPPRRRYVPDAPNAAKPAATAAQPPESEKPPDLKEAPGGTDDLLRIEEANVAQATLPSQPPVAQRKPVSSLGDVTPTDAANNGGEPPPDPFPAHLLPPVAHAIAEEVSRITGLPLTLPGACAIGFLSAAIGAGLRVRSGPDRSTRGNLYLVISALSGTGKSEAFRHIAAPFVAIENEMAERWKENDLPDAQADVDLLESEIGALKKAATKDITPVEREEIRQELTAKKKKLLEAQEKLSAPALSCEDITVERLAVLMSHNNEQMASLSSDAGSILNNLLGRYNKLERTDEGVYLKAFSGDPVRVDRISRPPVWLVSPTLTALWLVQPDKIVTMLGSDALKDGGLVPRLLMGHSHAEPQYVVEGAVGIPDSVTKDWAALNADLIKTFRLAAEPVTINPAAGALRLFNEDANRVVDRRKADLKDVSIFAARWNEQAWRIAVCLHAGLHGAEAGRHELSEDTASNAIALAGWFADQQLDILSHGRGAAAQAKADEVLELLANKPVGITATDIYRKRIVGTAQEARELLARLEAGGQLVGLDSKPERGGHVTRSFKRA